MARTNGESFVLTRRLITTRSDASYLDKKMRIVERLYNTGVKHCIHLLSEIRKDVWYQYAIKMYQNSKNQNEQKIWAEEIFLVAANYGLTEYDIHTYLGKGKTNAYQGGIGINIVQKTGTRLYAGVKKALFGKRLHYCRFGATESFEDKRANSGIIYHPKTDTVSVMGHEIRLKQCRQTDHYMQEAMLHKIRYCRIVRRAFGTSYRYFVQFVMEGSAPRKLTPGNNKIGLDPGVSTMTAYSGDKLHFIELSKDAGSYTKQIVHLQRVYDHQIRVNNPECFHKDGTFRKGSKIHYTKGMYRTAMRLKTAYRKRSVYVKRSNGYDTNRLIESGTTLILEPMTYRNLARRSRAIARQDKSSDIKDKRGNSKQICKYKRRRRFGHSILIHSPSAFISQLESKTMKYGGICETVNTAQYKASQYNHVTDEYEKHGLSDRYKQIGEYIVQRDCYSAFLLYHKKDPAHVNRTECINDFDNFLNCQEVLVATGIVNPNFGLTKGIAA